jgi:uncharacterized protein DUF6152
MTRIPVVVSAALTLTLTSATAFAHHGFAGRYDEEHPVTVQATVVEFQFTNPHSVIVFDAKDASGKTERWQAELGGASALRRVDGWTQTMLKAGDQLTIIGPQAKNGAPDMNLSHESKITMTATGKVIHNSIKAEQAAPAAAAN